MDVVYSINKVPIRLTDERWVHIVENHEDLAGHYEEILGTVENPDFIVSGYRGAKIAIKKKDDRHYLCVVYKEISRKDGFIITSYFSSRMNKEGVIWQRQKNL